MPRESLQKVFKVTLLLAVVCSSLVSFAAVSLRDKQQKNVELEIKRNILFAAGLYDEKTSVEQTFQQQIEPRIVDLESGEFVAQETLDPHTFDQKAAARDPKLSIKIPPDALGGIPRREKYGLVYLVQAQGSIKQVVLPFYGKGLWSTMYGFVAIDDDFHTVRGLTFAEHGETPGLGGEVDNQRWKTSWQGKQLYDEAGKAQIHLIRGRVDPNSKEAAYQIDGLAGSTLTSKGVTRMIQYWLGEQGYKPFLAKLSRKGELND